MNPPSAFQNILDIFALIETLFTILGIAVGGVWAYYKFFRGRTFRSRLELDVSGQLYPEKDCNSLLVRSTLKNVGLSKVTIERRGSALRIYSQDIPAGVAGVVNSDWTRLSALGVFEDHGWIEPGETIEDEILVSIEKGDYRAIRLNVRVVSKGISWKAKTVLYTTAKEPQSEVTG